MSLTEQMVLAEVRRLTERDLRLWIREGWVRPSIGEPGAVFDEVDVARLRLLCDMRKEMALPLGAVPVVLTLIDQLYRTRRDLRMLLQAVEDQPDNIRRSVAASLCARAHGDAGGGIE